ncbi:N-acetylglutamate synthase [Cryphonectria parasitica EP155]|uniref:Amino-acid acetyltransferase, mitochondrial n=1 Tax=Cryphonectria parasitica (strain ATCC 38755 / EP155) TaxID=660469 RepID=A0A9P4Y5M4_CRYP1|nr:N-acetylglutamate synthase [Cryphonectria parasitica EP155]KAF3767362.1 N-acetylglutamate synthase [Cryphonectria parasitica EP155]
MILRHTAWRKATIITEASVRTKCSSSNGSTAASSATQNFRVASPKDEISQGYLKEHYASISKKAQQKRSRDRDFYVSVLESSSATKRDAKLYLQTFGPTVTKNPSQLSSGETTSGGALPSSALRVDPLTNGTRSIYETPRFVQGSDTAKQAIVDGLPHVAIIKFRLPQDVDDGTLRGVAKTIAQLRALGLLSVVVLDCELKPDDTQWSRRLNEQIYRLAGAIDEYGEPWTTIVDAALMTRADSSPNLEPLLGSCEVLVDEDRSLLVSLLKGSVAIVPPVVQEEDGKSRPVDPSNAVVSITRYLSGLQFAESPETGADTHDMKPPAKKAFVDRVIVLDPLGGIPAKNRWNNAHVFLNLEDELEAAKAHLQSMASDSTYPQQTSVKGIADSTNPSEAHLKNLDLIKKTLAILPSTSSALITTPREAANLQPQVEEASTVDFVGSVGTRRSHNPLIHNLLTDRPSHSSSLPLGRIKPILRNANPASNPVMSPTTLAKRGMPVTIYPEPSSRGWTPPRPGEPRLKLTDTCVDLGRLVHLIDDSFNRKLDVQDYLHRVEKSLAGIIIAGEYEGGAILTWERPFGMDEQTLYESGRLVPYLDKFAVLKKSQGAGGVADIVFNAMVRDCFPEGVCWRSRKNNPVNKWYFERSRGTMKLPGSNWSMFWTTPNVVLQDQRIRDYEDVCRNIQPSWADNKHVVD